MAREKTVEEYLRESVKRRGGLCLKLWAISYAGIPDRIVLMPGGRMFFAETKSTGKTLRKLQQVRFDQLRALGFKCYKIDSSEQAKQILNDFI